MSLAVLSLFSGMGGLDYGFAAAGFDTRVCIDVDPDACATLSSAADWSVVNAPIDDRSTKQLLSLAGVGVGELAVVMGGAPCQPFSKSGYWVTGDARRLADPRAATLASLLRVVEESLPQVVVFENVRGFVYRDKAEGLAFLLERLQQINAKRGTKYRPSYHVVQSSDFGVPQKRERFLLVADRDGRVFDFTAIERPGLRTAWDAIADVQPAVSERVEPRGRWAGLLPSIPEGANYLWHTDRGGGLPLFGWRTRYWNFLLKLAKRLPSWTIQAHPGPAVGPFHWDNRRLSIRELCRLQTIPDTVEVHGDAAAAQRQIGNAVPSALAELLGRAIAGQFFRIGYSRGPTLLPMQRLDCPSPATICSVPVEYQHLVGIHAAHK